MGTQAREVWVWDPVDGESFQHPGELPTDEEGVKSFFVDKIFGPRVAKISKATMVDKKGSMTMIQREDGSNHEVPVSRVLPWYEGLLLLQEIEAVGGVAWFTEHVQQTLDKERQKYSKSFSLASSLYVEKKLLDTAVTGARYVDQDNKEHHFRRDKLAAGEPISEKAQEEMDGFWAVDDVTGYMPPWEAFCNQRCGLYQEFYEVRWDKPFTEQDYSKVENGSSKPGTTWEPDECLPPQMDGHRRREKRNWARKKKDQEAKEKTAEAKEKRKAPKGERRLVKVGRYRRDGEPLIVDMFRSALGHDFAPEPLDEGNHSIRHGWPRKPEEYPPGFGVAEPPGFCLATCDCMDDQRAQKPWETSKNWLEDPERTTKVLKLIENFGAQTRFVRRRGQVSKQWHFESLQPKPLVEDVQQSAAFFAAHEVEQQILKALQEVPLSALINSQEEVRIPALAFMKDEDYAPVRFQLAADSRARRWAKIGPEDGLLSAVATPSTPAAMSIELHHHEAVAATVDCVVKDTSEPHWRSGTVNVVARFSDPQCQLTRAARTILYQHLGTIYDFETKTPKEINFGGWLACMELVLRLLRSLVSANVLKPEKRR